MYPVAEFRTVALRRARRGGFTALAALGTLFLFAVTAVHLSDPWAVDRPTRAVALVWATLAAAGVTLALEVRWKLDRHPFTRCPLCRRRLTDHISQVVASGCCPHCGERVLQPPAEEPPADALVPRADYIAADTAYQRRGVPILFGGLGACYFGVGGAYAAVNALAVPFPLDVVVGVALALVAPVSLVAVLLILAAGGKRNPALACPSCGKLLAGPRMLVAATGNCYECGRRALVPRHRPLPPPHLGPLWTVAGVTERVKERRRVYRRALASHCWVWPALAGFACWVGWLWSGWLATPPNWWRRDAVIAGVAAAVITFVVPGWLALRWVVRSGLRRHPLDCPRCGREFLPSFARGTKCCNRCGWRIVATSPPAA